MIYANELKVRYLWGLFVRFVFRINTKKPVHKLNSTGFMSLM
ncbi:hypothetical protein YPPY09_3647 [Yersinia pestis PY-09]|nr:hypothetical protein YPPY09_3647 [Yersinia pestis PY-09]